MLWSTIWAEYSCSLQQFGPILYLNASFTTTVVNVVRPKIKLLFVIHMYMYLQSVHRWSQCQWPLPGHPGHSVVSVLLPALWPLSGGGPAPLHCDCHCVTAAPVVGVGAAPTPTSAARSQLPAAPSRARAPPLCRAGSSWEANHHVDTAACLPLYQAGHSLHMPVKKMALIKHVGGMSTYI